jgi:hypothetical protein
MKLLIFSDIHSDLKTLDRLLDIEADYYFAAGDLVSWARGLDRAGDILKRKAEKVYVIPGNHESPGGITSFCAQYGLHDFHGKSIEIGGFHAAGLGCSSPTPFNTPGEYSEHEIAARLAPFAPLAPLILICHCPPKPSLLDNNGKGLHFGSTAVASFIEQHQPGYFFCGHVHEAEGVAEKIGSTIGRNVGKRGYLLDLGKIES